MILGIDLGNVNVKTSEKIIYPNKITQDERLYEDIENVRVEYEGKRYVMGNGEYQTNYLKADKKHLMVSLLTAIAKSTENNINQIVLGLPIQQYKSDRGKLEEKINKHKINEIILNDKPRQIIISECKVFPEGLAIYYSLDNTIKSNIGNRDIVIIDVGGRTTDICLYAVGENKRKLLNYITIPAGTLNVYSDFIKAVNDKFGLDKLKEDATDILKQGLWVDGERESLKFTKDIFIKYLERILAELKLNYPIRTAQCILCGGGGILFQGLFKKEIKSLIVMKDIYANAKGFKRVGENIWR
jgi:plasmid segregation protein ParM